MMNSKNKKLSLVVSVLGVLAISISFGYFFSQIVFKGEGAQTTLEAADVQNTILKTEGVLSFDDLSVYPGHKNVSSIKVTATGDQKVLYNVIWTGTNALLTPLNYYVYRADSEQTPSINCEKVVENGEETVHYYETCSNVNFENLGNIVASGAINSSEEELTVKLLTNEEVQATTEGTEVYYYVVLEFPNLDKSQNFDMNGSFTGAVKTKLLGELDTTNGS